MGSEMCIRDRETLNNLVQINVALGQSGKAANVESQISSLEQSVLSRLQGLTAMSSDPEQIAVFDGKRDEMIAAFKAQQTTEEIEQMIAKLHGGVGAAVKAMGTSHEMANGTVGQSEKVQRALENILGAVGMIVDQNQQIAAAVEQQTAVAHDIDQNIVEINRAGERTAEGAHQTENASRALSAQVVELKQLISAFRV